MQYLDTAIVTVDLAREMMEMGPRAMIDAAKDHAIALSTLADRRELAPRRFGPRIEPDMGGWVKAAVVNTEVLQPAGTVRVTICVEGWREDYS